MNKLAQLTGYTPGSASVTFGNIKRKIKLLGEGVAASGPSTPKKAGGPGRSKAGAATPKSSGKRTSAAAGAEGADETPTKRKKAVPKKSTRAADSDSDEELAFRAVKREEVEDINAGANDLFGQQLRQHTASFGDGLGYGLEHDESS